MTKQHNLPLIFSALMLTMLMSSLGQMIFATALPTIVGELGGVEHMSWVISGFLVTMTISMPLAGRLGDMWGRKWLYIGGIAIFGIGSALGGFSQSMTALIIGRAIQGFGAGNMMVSSQAIVAEVTTSRERGKYMGIMGAVFGLSSVLGPVLGGWFTDGPGWRWAMWMNIPLALLAITVCTLVLKLHTGERSRFDALGALFLAITTTALILMTTWAGSEYAWSHPVIWALAATVVIGSVITIIVELRAASPLIPLQLFQKRNMVLATASGTMLGLAMFGVLGYLPTYLQMVHTLSPTAAGLMMVPMMLGMVVISTVVGFVIVRTGRYKVYPITGMALVTAVLVWMTRLSVETSLWTIGVQFLIFGIGLGCVMQVLVLIVQNTFPIAQVGTATAANNFFRQIGGAVGASLVGSLFIHNMREEIATHMPQAVASLGPEGAAYARQFATEGPSHLTPSLLTTLPEPVAQVILNAYNDGLTPVIVLMVPLASLALLLVLPIKEDRLKEAIV